MGEVGGLDEGVGREEAADHGIVEAGVGVDDAETVVVLVAGEAAPEGERDRGLLSVPTRIIHAVAPGVEVGALHGVLRLVHHDLPAAQAVPEDVVEAVGGTVLHMHRHDASLGIDVVETAGGAARRLHLVEAGDAGDGLLQEVVMQESGVPALAVGAVVDGGAVAVLRDGDGTVPEAVGHLARGVGHRAGDAASDGGDGVWACVTVGVRTHPGVGGDVALAVVGEGTRRDAVHRVGDEAVEGVVGVGLRLASVGLGPRGDEAPGVVGVGQPAILPAYGVGDIVAQAVDVGAVGDVAVADGRGQPDGVAGVLHARAVAVAALQGLAQPVAGVDGEEQAVGGGGAYSF